MKLLLLLLLTAAVAHAAPRESGRIALAWNPNPEPGVHYIAYWSHFPTGPFIEAGKTSETRIELTDLPRTGTLYFCVAAANSRGLRGPFSAVISADMATESTSSPTPATDPKPATAPKPAQPPIPETK